MEKLAACDIRCEKENTRTITLVKQINTDKETLFMVIIVAAAFFYCAMVIVPILTLFKVSGFNSFLSAVTNEDNLSAAAISIFTSTCSTIMAFVVGTPLVYWLTGTKSGLFAKIVELIIGLPAVLPPAVAGIALLLTFGRNGFLGQILKDFDIQIVFTPLAVILAQFFVSSCLYIQVLKSGVDTVSTDILDAAYVFGAGKIEAFIKIIIPMMKKTIAAGLVLSWTRALGEFGATIMFAGNVVGRTRTAPLQVYTLMQTDIKYAAALSVVMLLISSFMLLMTKLLLKENTINSIK